ncbi:hypothetical protein CVD25_22730 [Bacillus canaveralius]|uniref:Uncharacterized protein n=1 Tax=Bacillus canaveralius TaxID=1403243 RepID=A0A2N5GNC7_9BACI|nr:hypothetical protein [Bacillus canaveralius]PLR83889.1 hypothetical protein CU635_08270 [Bacillus canaveralius]PLR88429.1 hypothetical protein CVD25_22730 [Bacillus canaveralius]
MKVNRTVGEIMNRLYQIWQVKHNKWPTNTTDKSHLEFILTNFDPTSEEQIALVAELCYIVKSGEWQMSYEALKNMLPDKQFEMNILEEVKDYFTGKEYFGDQKSFDEYIKNQRNPFILELLSHIMLLSIENTLACKPYEFSIQGVHYMHLNSKKQGLDLAAIAKDNLKNEYYLIIGESKNRQSPSEGTKEALEAFKTFDSGRKWPDIRQVMKAVANSFEKPTDRISEKISKHILWQKKIIYRLTIEHRSKKPRGGSQFRDFKVHTPNATCEQFRQCEAIHTERLDYFYDAVSIKVTNYIEEKEKEIYV